MAGNVCGMLISVVFMNELAVTNFPLGLFTDLLYCCYGQHCMRHTMDQ